MKLTGERYMSDMNSAQISYEHWHRYYYAEQFVKDKDVLDIACGEGYGSDLMAKTAKSVIGIDICEEAVDFARQNYTRSNLSFRCGKAQNIPIHGKNLFDAIVSFETIEHLDIGGQEAFLKEIKRLLKKEGVLIISSPNKLLYSDIPKHKNEFHINELYEEDFCDLLKKHFNNVSLSGQKVFSGSNIWKIPQQSGGIRFTEYHVRNDGKRFVEDANRKEAVYFIAVCCDSAIEASDNSFLIDKSLSIATERDMHIRVLEQSLSDRDDRIRLLEQCLSDRDDRIRLLEHEISKRDDQLHAVNKVVQDIYASKKWKLITKIAAPLISARKFFSGICLFPATCLRDYEKWIKCYDTTAEPMRAKMRDRIKMLKNKPLISVVMPVYDPEPAWLIQAIESVRKQIYPYWELCIADDASTNKKIRRILEKYRKKDSRIKVIFRESNGNISSASNSALGLATGNWIALLDHDDLLAETAFFWISDTINLDPKARVIYSDEDKISRRGKRFDPYFKCGWNRDLFYSQNYLSHLGVYEAGLVKQVGGFRPGFEGAQDYDLALRCIELVQEDQIHHIPRILYHWRAHGKSTAQKSEAKPYASHSGKLALDDHFGRQGIKASVEVLDFSMFRVRYPLPYDLPLVSIIILSRNKPELLRRCIESLLDKTTYSNYEIVLVDNCSDCPETLLYLKELGSNSRIRVIFDSRPFNFSALNNSAVSIARGEIIVLLNNDTEVISPGWLSEMVSHALRPGIGAVGARLLYPNGTLQHGGVVLGIGGVAGHAHKNLPRHKYGYFGRAILLQSFSAVTAACLAIKKSIYEKVGGLNESDFEIGFNDVDFCLRVREAGYRNIWTPYAELYHIESSTRGLDDTPEKQVRFMNEAQRMKQIWGNRLLDDPAYSPNLNIDFEDFRLAWPPRIKREEFVL